MLAGLAPRNMPPRVLCLPSVSEMPFSQFSSSPEYTRTYLTPNIHLLGWVAMEIKMPNAVPTSNVIWKFKGIRSLFRVRV